MTCCYGKYSYLINFKYVIFGFFFKMMQDLYCDKTLFIENEIDQTYLYLMRIKIRIVIMKNGTEVANKLFYNSAIPLQGLYPM